MGFWAATAWTKQLLAGLQTVRAWECVSRSISGPCHIDLSDVVPHTWDCLRHPWSESRPSLSRNTRPGGKPAQVRLVGLKPLAREHAITATVPTAEVTLAMKYCWLCSMAMWNYLL
jgi:hypothetical protein